MAQLGTHSALDFQHPIGAIAPAGGIETLFERQPVERFAAGETVFFEGDTAKHVFEITDGVVRLCKLLVDGRRIVTGFLFAGDVIGVSQRHRFGYSAEAVTPVKLRRVSRRRGDRFFARRSFDMPHRNGSGPGGSRPFRSVAFGFCR